MESLDCWIDRQYRHAGRCMLASISATGVNKARPGFGQMITPQPGSVVASPVAASYDPDPDYFFHWYRDSAVVIDALRVLHLDDGVGRTPPKQFADFVHFSQSLRQIDGRALAASPTWRERVAVDFKKFLRSDADLAAIHGDTVIAETRVNPDATADISSWPRPQHDGPAMRALTLLRWSAGARLGTELADAMAGLLRSDLAYTRAHWREPCFDIWEEELGLHYYTLCVSAAALAAGAAWLGQHGTAAEAQACAGEAQAIRRLLDDFWLADAGYYRSRQLASGERSGKELDISVILAAIHSEEHREAHSVHDERIHATLDKLEALFDANYLINRDRPRECGPALGRYADDRYYSGGAYYFSTLGAAEFCFRAARGSTQARDLRRRGDAYLETVRRFTPVSGDLSEQFDQNTGAQSSAKHLAWSYAAFISCIGARRAMSVHG
ncbi:MAG TPA: glycoside hydrolase family 15 protein [Steroidobacteraceae bacterium]